MNRKRSLGIAILGLVIGVLCAETSRAAVRVYVPVPPPPVVVETAPAPPSPAHVWITGYHRWDGGTYVWVPGHYELRPRPRVHWVPGHWSKHRRGWYWVPGHWR